MDFVVDRTVTMNFVVKSQAIPVYMNHTVMTNRLRIDSEINYFRYKRLEEIKAIKLVDLKGKTLDQIGIERG